MTKRQKDIKLQAHKNRVGEREATRRNLLTIEKIKANGKIIHIDGNGLNNGRENLLIVGGVADSFNGEEFNISAEEKLQTWNGEEYGETIYLYRKVSLGNGKFAKLYLHDFLMAN